MNQILIQTETDASEAYDFGDVIIIRHSKKTRGKVFQTTIVKEYGKPDRRYCKAKKVKQ